MSRYSWEAEQAQRRKEAESFGRLGLFISSIMMAAIVCLPVAVALIILGETRGYGWCVVGAPAGLGLVVVVARVLSRVAGMAVGVCERLYRWATRSDRSWSLITRLSLATVWPLVLLFWVVVAPVYASINDSFQGDSDKESD